MSPKVRVRVEPRNYATIKWALDGGAITPMKALFEWTVWALKQTTLELKPYFEHVKATLPLVEWHKTDDEWLLVHGYNPVTWKSPTDFYQWADNFMGQIFTMGAYLRQYIGEHDPQRAKVVLEEIVTNIKRTAAEHLQNAQPLNPHGANQHGDRTLHCNVHNQGNHAPYLASRIKRDHPEIAQRVMDGEFKSIRQAAIAAGIVKPPDPVKQIQRLWGRLSQEQRGEVLRWISNEA